MLPRLSGEPGLRLFLLDVDGGAVGLAEQLDHLARALDVDRVAVLDVGGDAVAGGHEPGLRSPVADSLAVAAAWRCSAPADVFVAGPGADDELTRAEVAERARVLGGRMLGRITTNDAETVRRVLDWHPTEATAVVAASAAGLRGDVETRQGGRVPLGDAATEVWRFPLTTLDDWPIARALAGTTTFAGANDAARRMGLVPELDAETQIAARSRGTAPDTDAAPDSGHSALMSARRLLETAHIGRDDEARYLATRRPTAYLGWGVWRG